MLNDSGDGEKASGKKNPGLSPGKRYVIQRIGAFGQMKPCERQRHDAVACMLLLQSRRPCREAGPA